MNKHLALTFSLLIFVTSSIASIVVENRNYTDVSFKFIDKSGDWIDEVLEARSFKEIKMKSTKVKIDTDNMFVEYKVYSNNVYTFFIDQNENFWDIKKVTKPKELLNYIQRGMIKNRK